MGNGVKRIYVEKKPGFDIEARRLLVDLRDNLGISGLESLRVINRYDVEGITDDEYLRARETIFAEPPVDLIYDETLPLDCRRLLAFEYLPGQYDQRADSAAQCIQILSQRERPEVRTAKLIALTGDISEAEFAKIKNYCLNPLEAREASFAKPETLRIKIDYPPETPILEGFSNSATADLEEWRIKLGLAMSPEDLAYCRDYFKTAEKRDPTLTEVRVLDTYWSDHCRHTTFATRIESVRIEDGPYSDIIKEAYHNYLESKEFVYQGAIKEITLMDLATIVMKEFRKRGRLNDLEESDEINACGIVAPVEVAGVKQDWLVMFKNETHNHPTEIEPFGGAATCLGGAIRDPLSGRSYVYQAMRVTGSGDPRVKIAATLSGKLPQRKITTGAAAGFSSYGNQIGLATGQVTEIYDQGYVAKRMEIGAVIGAAPRENVLREKPKPGDAVILLGGGTGRDGCGGATGSSKEHTEDSLQNCGAEVQKGNPPTERKIQRLFREPSVSRMIKKCNDFGAGGVAVAIGELADGLEINLDVVPKKYEGLDGTELAISESQERMAVLVAPENRAAFCRAAALENLEATPVATVTAAARLKMNWRGRTIVNLSRDFLNTNGARQTATVKVVSPAPVNVFELKPEMESAQATVESFENLRKIWLKMLSGLNICSQKGLAERFDGTIGAGTVLMPFGGKYQLTPAESMAAKLPVLSGETSTGALMSFGFDPVVAKWSPFHGAVYAVVEAVTKIVATGGDYRKIRLTLQEYFEKLGRDPVRWGKPFAALLGAYYAQQQLGIPAIGGKDSMSGTFRELTVPPTLVAFAVAVGDIAGVISPEFKEAGSSAFLLKAASNQAEMPDFTVLQRYYRLVYELNNAGKIRAAQSVRLGGIAAAISKMCFGNRIGFEFSETMAGEELFTAAYGSIVIELSGSENPAEIFRDLPYRLLGRTTLEPLIKVNGGEIYLAEALQSWEEPLEEVFPTRVGQMEIEKIIPEFTVNRRKRLPLNRSLAKPRILIPVFPGTNCEYDTRRAFERAGGAVETLVFRNLTAADIEATVDLMVKAINNAQIVMLPGGFSAGDEPDGSGKFIAAVFRNPRIATAVMELLRRRDGLILGICNGFQALIKLGLVPYGEIRKLEADSPTLTFNTIGRHVSCLVRTKIVSNVSPWLSKVEVGEIHTIPVSHGEGRFFAGAAMLEQLAANGRIATRYVDWEGKPTMDIRFNPNGSVAAVEGLTSPDGRVFGKMGHSERCGLNLYQNVPGLKDQRIFEAGVAYFK